MKTLTTFICMFTVTLTLHCAETEKELVPFVTSIYEEGFRFDVAEQLDGSKLDAVIPMLESEEYSQYWGNVVMTMGVLGNEKHLGILKEYIQNGYEGYQVSLQGANSRLSAITAIGIMCNRDIPGARNTLVAIFNGDIVLNGQFNGKPVSEVYGTSIQGLCIKGLSLCASAEAELMLKRIAKEKSKDSFVQERVADAISAISKLRKKEIDYIDVINPRYRKFKNQSNDAVEENSEGNNEVNKNLVQVPEEQALAEAMEAFMEFKELLLNDNITELSRHLADNGEPLLVDVNEARKEQVTMQLTEGEGKKALENVKDVLSRVGNINFEALRRTGQMNLQREVDKMIVTIEIPGSAEKIRGVFQSGTPSGSIGKQGDVIIYMIYKDNRWFWNPPGW